MNQQRAPLINAFLFELKMKKNIFVCLILAIVFVTASCNSVTQSDDPAVSPTPDSIVINTEIPVPPTITSTPLPERVIFVVSDGTEQKEIDVLQAVLRDLSASEGLQFEILNSLDQQIISPEVKLVITLSPDIEIANLASANLGTEFLVIGNEQTEQTQNLSFIYKNNNRPDQQGFLAGYLAAVITSHWRVGMIGYADDPQSNAQRNGFANGMIFYCGLCRPSIPPFVQYPINISLPIGSGVADYQIAAEQLLANGVETVYIPIQPSDPALLDTLANAGIHIIGTEPPHDAVRPQYIASISSDIGGAVEAYWLSLMAGDIVEPVNPGITITDINQDLLTVGRQDFVEQVHSDLQQGYIDTGVDPVTGELN